MTAAPIFEGTGARRRLHNPLLLVLIVAGVLAVSLTGFVGLAPNRLVSGQPLALWAAADAGPTGVIVILGALLLAAAFARPTPFLHRGVVVLSAALFAALLAALAEATARLAMDAAPVARISPGAAFWVLCFCAVLALADAMQRLRTSHIARLIVAAAIAAGIGLLAASGVFDTLSLAREYASRREAFAAALIRHIVLVAASVAPAIAIGFPLGVTASRRPALRGPLFAALNTLQAIPSIALFGLLIVPLSALGKAVPALARHGIGGVGMAPAVIALILYALLPIVRNTSAGLTGVERAVIEAARGMGLSPRQIFWRVELPLAAPVLLAGLRIVLVQTIGLAVVAALIGAGGLGGFVFAGLGQYAVDLVLLGALPAIGLALAADFLLGTVAELLRRRIT